MRGLFVAATLLLATVSLALPSRVAAAPTCFGKTATYVMKPGEGRYDGTPGNDVVIGTNGNDLILFGFTSTGFDQDVACSLGGNDEIDLFTIGSYADGGTGNDRLDGYVLKGGAGNDYMSTSYGGTAYGESGDDEVYADQNATADGGSGDDYVGGENNSTILGSSGSDTMIDFDGTSTVDCGSGTDEVTENADPVRRCERTIPVPPL